MTLEELDALEDARDQRYELWHGQPVAITGGTLRHNLIALGLSRAIYPRLQPACRVVVADVKLRLGEAMDSNAAYPDVMAARGVCRCAGGSGRLNPGGTRP
jgi:hypothetical protein